MALLHPAPTCPLPTGHHHQNAASVLRRPALVHSPRLFRLHAQKGPSTGTPSGSESDNVVLKAAWYASEALGVAASFFRPSSSPEGDAEATDGGVSDQSLPLGPAQVAEAIKDDFARSYFVTGNLTLRAYEEDCKFADPAGSFRGLQRFKRNCTNFGSLLEKSDMKLTKWEDLQVRIAMRALPISRYASRRSRRQSQTSGSATPPSLACWRHHEIYCKRMALLQPAPPPSRPTGHHHRNTGSVLRRPALVHSRPRRFRLHAQKSPRPGTGTPSGSESDNVVLKAAWYASEALGVAASYFRPPSPDADAGAADDEGASESQKTLGPAEVAEAIKGDFARSYFVTGNLTLRAYEEDCEFADPAGSFRGLQRFKRNCTNFGSLLEKSDMKLTKWEDLQDKSIGHWRFSCVMSFPWRPILSATGYTEYYFDAESGKVCRHVENWNVPKMALLRQIFRPSKWAWEKR